jgi:thioredoxin reductase (NADPH)
MMPRTRPAYNPPIEEPMQDFDVVVIGAGVAGLTAATFAARYGLKVVVVERRGAGGQIVNVESIENFAGFPRGIAGHELGPLLHEQAEAAGAEFRLDTIETIEFSGADRILRSATDSWRARSVIIAAGSAPRLLGIPGEEQFRGKGVSHCASCDGPLFAGLEVCVVGGGDSALDEALVLVHHAARVTVFHRDASFGAQRALLHKAAAASKIELRLETSVEEILGEDAVSGVRLRGKGTDASRVQNVRGVFVYVGLEPNTAFLRGMLALDGAGHIETDISMKTSVEGVFAAGDIRKGSVAQLAAAAGDGATAAISAFRYLEQRG